MKTETARKIARCCTDAEIQKWSSGVGKFVAGLQPSLTEKMGLVCEPCPFRNLLNVGGCLGEECPIYAVRLALKRACARATNGVREIYKTKYNKSAYGRVG